MNNSFAITPMNQRVSLNPGDTYTGKITVINPSDSESEFSYQAYVSPYGVVGENYDADLSTMSDWTQMVDWIKITNPTGKLAPNETKDVEFTITVPTNAPAGGQYAAIMIGPNNEGSSDGGIAIENVYEMASIVYANVAGKTVHKGEILENNVPGFSIQTPVSLTALINNEGNVHEDAVFTIKVSNFFTGEVILPTEENTGRYNEIIMPGTTRYVSRDVSNLPVVGVVKVSQSISYNGEVSTQEKDVIICPIWFMVTVVVVLAAIVALIVRGVKKHKKKKALVENA